MRAAEPGNVIALPDPVNAGSYVFCCAKTCDGCVRRASNPHRALPSRPLRVDQGLRSPIRIYGRSIRLFSRAPPMGSLFTSHHVSKYPAKHAISSRYCVIPEPQMHTNHRRSQQQSVRPMSYKTTARLRPVECVWRYQSEVSVHLNVRDHVTRITFLLIVPTQCHHHQRLPSTLFTVFFRTRKLQLSHTLLLPNATIISHHHRNLDRTTTPGHH